MLKQPKQVMFQGQQLHKYTERCHNTYPKVPITLVVIKLLSAPSSFAKEKVRDLRIEFVINQNVARLYVSMHHFWLKLV